VRGEQKDLPRCVQADAASFSPYFPLPTMTQDITPPQHHYHTFFLFSPWGQLPQTTLQTHPMQKKQLCQITVSLKVTKAWPFLTKKSI
jgi:hypothetical protein